MLERSTRSIHLRRLYTQSLTKNRIFLSPENNHPMRRRMVGTRFTHLAVFGGGTGLGLAPLAQHRFGVLQMRAPCNRCDHFIL